VIADKPDIQGCGYDTQTGTIGARLTMNNLVVGIGDCCVSKDPDSSIVTYALGSCIAVVIHDSVAGVGGLLHFMLPESSLDPVKADKNPFQFADTGIPILFRNAYQLGAEKRRLTVTVTGGAQIMDPQGTFNIGKRNCLAMRKIFWKAGVLIHGEYLGGMVSRTVRLEVRTGKIMLREAGQPEQELPRAAAGMREGI
jgi:chemotaxis protein CheD